MHRHAAISLLQALPASTPSLDPCQTANPTLWAIWCHLKCRPDTTSASVWTEVDVVASAALMINRHLREITS